MTVGLIVLILSFKLVFGKQEGFIVGGSFAQSIKEFPHVAFLTFTDKRDVVTVCGSSILNQYILITAAHCLDGAIEITATVGSVDREKGAMYDVASYVQHPNWDTKRVTHDVALCKVRKPLKLGISTKRVVMLERPPLATKAVLAGWGAVEEQDYSDTDLLKHAIQRLWSRSQCQKVMDVPPGTICGGETKARGQFASRGDSGSGLLIQDKIIIGLVSYKDTRISQSLVVYTHVPYFYDWITKMSERLVCMSR